MKKYPIISYVRKKENPGRRCDKCKDKANFKIEVQFSFLRGEDEVYVMCEKCKNELVNELSNESQNR